MSNTDAETDTPEEVARLRVQIARLQDDNADLQSRLSLAERGLQWSGGSPAARAVCRWRRDAETKRLHGAIAQRLASWEADLCTLAHDLDGALNGVAKDVTALHQGYGAALHESETACVSEERIAMMLAEKARDAVRHQREAAKLTALAASAQASTLGLLHRSAPVASPNPTPDAAPDAMPDPAPATFSRRECDMSSPPAVAVAELAPPSILEGAATHDQAQSPSVTAPADTPQLEVLSKLVADAVAAHLGTPAADSETRGTPYCAREEEAGWGRQPLSQAPPQRPPQWTPQRMPPRETWEEWKARQQWPPWLHSKDLTRSEQEPEPAASKEQNGRARALTDDASSPDSVDLIVGHDLHPASCPRVVELEQTPESSPGVADSPEHDADELHDGSDVRDEQLSSLDDDVATVLDRASAGLIATLAVGCVCEL